MKCFIVKLGGSIITKMDLKCKPDLSNIKKIVEIISKQKEKGHKIILIAGAGSFAHPDIKEIESKRKLNYFDLIKIRDQTNELQNIIISEFEKYNKKYNKNLKIVKETLPVYFDGNASTWSCLAENWISFADYAIPLLHGDLVLNKKEINKISGDDILRELGKRWKYKDADIVKRPEIIVLSKYPVMDKNPETSSNAKVIPKINHEVFKKIEKEMRERRYYDITGGMFRKLEILMDLSNMGINPYISTLKGFPQIFTDPKKVISSREGTYVITFPEPFPGQDEYIKSIRAYINNLLVNTTTSSTKTTKELLERFKEACADYPARSGKLMRPLILALSCASVGGDIKDIVPIATSIETVHNFSLVHDDIMDKDEMRRGKPTLHKIYGEGIAIIAGDTLLIEGINAALGVKKDKREIVLRKILDALIDISVGQVLDMEFERLPEVSVSDYLFMIERKTARLFEVSSELGGIMGNGSEKEILALKEYGFNLGMCFQMIDDLLGIIGETEIVGKSIGSDIKERKKSYTILSALSELDEEKRKEISNMLYIEYQGIEIPKDKVVAIVETIKKTDAIEKTKASARTYFMKAKNSLKPLPETDAKKMLEQLAEATFYRYF